MKLEKKTQVVGITLNIKGKEIELTIEEAKELKEELVKLFAEPVKEYVPYYPYIPCEPWITRTTGSAPPKLPEIYYGDLTCESSSTILGSYFSTGPTTATCGSRSFENVTVGGGCDVVS